MPPLMGFPLELDIGYGEKKNKNDEAIRWLKNIKIGLAV